MSSSFSSLNAALTGLYASQRLVEVSGHNIENMNTPGYTKQRISQKALGISSTPSIFAGSVPQGGGVEMQRLQRMGDIFLDNKLRLETGRAAEAKTTATAWSTIESAMNELGNQSIAKSLGDFYKSWGDVNNSPDNTGARATVIGKANALVGQIALGYTRMNDEWKNARAQVDALTADINTTMDSVAALNDRIRKEKNAGADVNELIDQRAQLVLKLSGLTGATGREREDGTIEVMLAGNSMVSKGYTNHFVVKGSADMPGIDAAPKDVFTAVNAKMTPAELSEKVTINGLETQRYQPEVITYKKEDADKLIAGVTPIAAPPTGSSKEEAEKFTAKETARYNAAVDTIKSYIGGPALIYKDMNPATTADEQQALRDKTIEPYRLSDYQGDEGPVRLTWKSGGHQVVIDEGTLGAHMKNLAPAGHPRYPGTIGGGGAFAEVGKLYNDVATRIAQEVNTIHAHSATNNTRTLEAGESLYYSVDPSAPAGSPAAEPTPVVLKDGNTAEKWQKANPGLTLIEKKQFKEGTDFFEFASADNKLPPAYRLKVAVKDANQVAAGIEKNGVYDGSVAGRLMKAQDNPASTINEWAKSVVDIGVHTNSAKDQNTLAEQSRRIAERAHASGTGVEMNEEVVNLIQGQHAYSGAARVMTTVNEMLDTLINLGRR